MTLGLAAIPAPVDGPGASANLIAKVRRDRGADLVGFSASRECSCDRGQKWAMLEAIYQLASLYRVGRGVTQDDKQAFTWMRSAAEKGHLKAQYNVGKMYLAGRGTAANTE